ncbi:putative glutathione-specific gamma-glutamylcyclotransferase 2 isoform X1 [Gigantopelta aegis]|uniref:putative glutathione-specific gamma-glutamylcyclotransferase 2 isoform X1 n=1 Tax=Gigantopelta aegis TaxID=1735272 RepID=UPI001B889829|nr:putative glutathione-specific gamma-glutamylcyclotransferase 2 isoform X1 [Gigantopelta aegis]
MKRKSLVIFEDTFVGFGKEVKTIGAYLASTSNQGVAAIELRRFHAVNMLTLRTRACRAATPNGPGETPVPGRVVTLVPSDNPNDCVWGLAYKIAKENVQKIVHQLDYREKDGYKLTLVTFYPEADLEPLDISLYIGNDQNPFFLGPAPLRDIAQQIYDAVGPSGTNIEYLLKLATASRDLFPSVYDSHLFTLEHEVKSIAKENGGL